MAGKTKKTTSSTEQWQERNAPAISSCPRFDVGTITPISQKSAPGATRAAGLETTVWFSCLYRRFQANCFGRHGLPSGFYHFANGTLSGVDARMRISREYISWDNGSVEEEEKTQTRAPYNA